MQNIWSKRGTSAWSAHLGRPEIPQEAHLLRQQEQQSPKCITTQNIPTTTSMFGSACILHNTTHLVRLTFNTRLKRKEARTAKALSASQHDTNQQQPNNVDVWVSVHTAHYCTARVTAFQHGTENKRGLKRKDAEEKKQVSWTTVNICLVHDSTAIRNDDQPCYYCKNDPTLTAY